MVEPERVPRVLAIDDCPMIRALLGRHLRHEPVELHLAADAATGVAMARELLPEVVLLDVHLGPEGSEGFAVLAALQDDPRTHDLSVIFLSGSGDTEHRVRALDRGAVDFIGKPFDAAELRARVRSALRLRRLLSMLAQKARIDGLTGLWNRAYFDRRLDEEVSESIRYGRPISLVLADVDHFKSINDRYGHPVGDEVIARFASILATGRASDVPCRYGGEEFALILPGTSTDSALEVAERLRRRLAAERFGGREDLVVTASFGVADLASIEQAGTSLSLVHAADEALYRAKSAGRDRVYALDGSTSRRRVI